MIMSNSSTASVAVLYLVSIKYTEISLALPYKAAASVYFQDQLIHVVRAGVLNMCVSSPGQVLMLP